jgi:5'-methylthioadenosine phosphorylase
MELARIGIIGGTGIYDLRTLRDPETVGVETDYGKVIVKTGEIGGKKVAFLARHGETHSIAPGNINYRANIAALRKIGVRQVFATACSGSMNPKYRTGDFVLLEQFLDFTKSREASFFTDDKAGPIGHLDNTNPYCADLGRYVAKAASQRNIVVKAGATYCCTEGPRFETAAEINMFRMLKGDLVGQTNYPEVVLAREAEMCYCAVAIVSNMAAGMSGSPITAEEVKQAMSENYSSIQEVIEGAVRLLPEDRDCECRHLLDKAYL